MLCFIMKVKLLCLGFLKENTTRNQWLSCIYNTVPEQFNPNIRVCILHTLYVAYYILILHILHIVNPFRTISWTWEISLQCQLCTKAVFIKWGNSNFARTVWRFWLTACKYVFLFKEFATDDSNASFEQCRVVLVVCLFSDHKCRHGNVYVARCNASRKKTV